MATTKRSPARAAQTLSNEALAVQARLHAEYELNDAGAVEVLTAGLHAFDTMRSAEALIRSQGVVVLDRYGTPKAHPAVDIARTARSQWLQALRMLGLHAEDAGDE